VTHLLGKIHFFAGIHGAFWNQNRKAHMAALGENDQTGALNSRQYKLFSGRFYLTVPSQPPAQNISSCAATSELRLNGKAVRTQPQRNQTVHGLGCDGADDMDPAARIRRWRRRLLRSWGSRSERCASHGPKRRALVPRLMRARVRPQLA